MATNHPIDCLCDESPFCSPEALALLAPFAAAPTAEPAYETDPVISDAEVARTEQYRAVIEDAMGTKR
jgi:hypothetical protein